MAGTIASLTNFVCLMTFLPLLLKLAVRLGFKAPKPSFAITAPIPVAWFVATAASARPIAALAIVVTGLLLIPYFLIQPHFSFEDFMSKDSTALTAAENIDEGVGGVAPLYISVPLERRRSPMSATRTSRRSRSVHEIVEKHLGKNKVISAAAFTHYADCRLHPRADLQCGRRPASARFVTDDGDKALVTGFMPTIISFRRADQAQGRHPEATSRRPVSRAPRSAASGS